MINLRDLYHNRDRQYNGMMKSLLRLIKCHPYKLGKLQRCQDPREMPFQPRIDTRDGITDRAWANISILTFVANQIINQCSLSFLHSHNNYCHIK